MNQTPLEEITERVAETVPGLTAAAQMVGLEDHRRMLRDNADRLRDAHRYGATNSGMRADEMREGDDMGNLVVTGDIYGDQAVRSIGIAKQPVAVAPAPAPAPQPIPQPQPEPQPTSKKPLSNLAKVGIIAALSTGSAGVGMAIPLIADALKPEPPPAVAPDANTWIEYDIEKWVPEE